LVGVQQVRLYIQAFRAATEECCALSQVNVLTTRSPCAVECSLCLESTVNTRQQRSGSKVAQEMWHMTSDCFECQQTQLKLSVSGLAANGDSHKEGAGCGHTFWWLK